MLHINSDRRATYVHRLIQRLLTKICHLALFIRKENPIRRLRCYLSKPFDGLRILLIRFCEHESNNNKMNVLSIYTLIVIEIWFYIRIIYSTFSTSFAINDRPSFVITWNEARYGPA